MNQSEITVKTLDEKNNEMEKKTNSLKTASKVISIIMKIGYTVMIVMFCITAATMVTLAISGGKTVFRFGGTNIIIADELPASMGNLTVLSAELLVMGGFLFTIFLVTYRMFHEISVTGNPFTAKYVTMVRAIGILIASMTVALGLTDTIMTWVTGESSVETIAEVPGISVGAIIFCLSYIIDYGCMLKGKSEADN